MSSFSMEEESTSLNFDTAAEPAKRAYDPLPIGEYRFVVDKALIKNNKNNDGKVLSLSFKALDEPHAGRIVFQNMNVVNKSEKAQQIARSELAGLLEAVGKAGERDVSKLVGCEVLCKIGIQPATEQYEARNVVKGYKPVTGVPLASTLQNVTTQSKSVPAFMGGKPSIK